MSASFDESLEWLESHIDFERVAPNRQDVPTLEPVRNFLAAIADPHHDYPTIHVTGTNGKGTTTTLCAALLEATGLRVGRYTSPDLHSITERIAVNGAPIAEGDFADVLSRLRDLENATGIVLTRFELLCAAAFLHFSDEGVDVAVIEVGLGGTWDSTNVIDADVSVLTNVDLDHTAVLGNSIAEIASDKVGIFRREGIAVVATTNAIVVERAIAHSHAIGSALWLIGDSFELHMNELALGGRLLSVSTPFARYDDVLLTLHGIHQGVNAATALVAAEAFLGRALGDDVVRETFAQASMPGRMELVARVPMIVVDGAHNPAGMRALAATLDGAFHVTGKRRCVVGMLSGRDVTDMVAPLLSLGFEEFHVAPPASPRAMSASDVAKAIRLAGGEAIEYTSTESALAHARELSTDDDLIVVAGSLYLVAEARAIIKKLPSRH